MDTVEQLDGTYFYKGFANLSAHELLFWIIIGERQTKLDADYPSSAPVCQFRCYLSLLAFHALTIPHNRHDESLSGHKPKITAPIRPNRTRQPSSRYPLFFSLPLAQAPRCCAPRMHKGEFKNWVKKTSRTPMG